MVGARFAVGPGGSRATGSVVQRSARAAQRGLGAAVAAGLTFDINAFVGAWVVAALGVLATRDRRPYRVLLEAAALFGVTALPVAIWIAGATADSGSLAFSMREYVRARYPAHFLIEAATQPTLYVP